MKPQVNLIQVGSVWDHPTDPEYSLTHVNGWQVVFLKGEYVEGDYALHVEPGFVIDTREEWAAHLDKSTVPNPYRTGAYLISGTLCHGILAPVPDFITTREVPKNCYDALRVVVDHTPLPLHTISVTRPPLLVPHYDLPHAQSVEHVFDDDEWVYATEKFDGVQFKAVCWEGKLYVGSKYSWIQEDETNVWWKTLRLNSGIKGYLESNPGHVLYGQIYGSVGGLQYGHRQGDNSFAAFAIYDAHAQAWAPYLDMEARTGHAGIPAVRILWQGKWPSNPASVYAFAEKATEHMAYASNRPHLSQGLVLTPYRMRYRWDVGFVSFKYLSQRYWIKTARPSVAGTIK